MCVCRLTVTSEEGLNSTAYATITVLPRPYYPPLVVAKGDLVIHLPKDTFTIDGSDSQGYDKVRVLTDMSM